MLTYKDIDEGKKAVVFDLDDVLFPKRDYLLQVYYLFANLLEYTETVPPAKDLTDFLKTAYEHHGEAGLFDRAAEVFGIPGKYQENFDRLHYSAQLPLKLLMYEPMRDLMRGLNNAGKRLFILTSGNPIMQLNKLKHMEWDGLDQVLKVYFREELLAKRYDPLEFLLQDNSLDAADILCIGTPDSMMELAGGMAVDRIDAGLFMKPSSTQKTHTQ